MKEYIIKRLALGVVLVVAVSFLVFSLMYMMPGDPIDIMISDRVSEETKAEMAHKYGYDLPFFTQYFNWVKGVCHLDFGTSARYRQPVWSLLGARIPYSLRLCSLSLLVEMLFALPLGLLCAVKKDSWIDKFCVNVSLVLTAVPAFWFGTLLIVVFAVGLGWLPISGYQTPAHYILPVAAIAFTSVGSTLRITKAEVLEVLHEKYVTTAYAKGLPRKRVLVKHVLRNSLIIVVTLTFMSIPWMITGAVITEKIFAFPGMGNLLLNSIVVQDMPVVQAVLLIIAILTVICNLASDIITAFLDPRIKDTISGGEN
ncbi:MAG: ABC transporter permease [Clostridia bacterium]|nr:ABC transporter permease [Clostridia bacterium]